MSELTTTNEEILAGLVNQLKSGEIIRLVPSNYSTMPVIDIYIMPKDVEWSYSIETKFSQYWKGSFLALEFHKEIWQASPSKASAYR